MALVFSIAHSFAFTSSFSKRRSSILGDVAGMRRGDYYPSIGGGVGHDSPMNDGINEEGARGSGPAIEQRRQEQSKQR
jgi:hypothetical protein